MNKRIDFLLVRVGSYILNNIHTFLVKRKRGIIIKEGSYIFFLSKIVNWSQEGGVFIGQNTMIGRCKFGYHAGMPFYTTLLNDGKKSQITIGNNCRINGAYIHAKKSITIGNNCVIASGVNIIDSNGHQTLSTDRTIGSDIPSEIIIGNNVWIGINVIVLKGSRIGDNCVLAAGSVVKGEIPSNTIVRTNQINLEKIVKIKRD